MNMRLSSIHFISSNSIRNQIQDTFMLTKCYLCYAEGKQEFHAKVRRLKSELFSFEKYEETKKTYLKF
jgi:hypothetical protein